MTKKDKILFRLRKQYFKYKTITNKSKKLKYELMIYYNLKCFCLDTNLISLGRIETMENEVNHFFNH